ncbi:hypothetical protein ES708_26466 [subsurface metagenome]
MIDPEFIYNNIEEYEIYPSHKEIFNTILENIEFERRLVITGQQFGGKSFFCRKLALRIKKKLNLEIDKILICDFPLMILELMLEKEILVLNDETIKSFLMENNLNEILDLKNKDLIILDEINSPIFDNLFKSKLKLENNQIIIKVIGPNVKGLFFGNKNYFEGLGYKIYDLKFPTGDERVNMLDKYISSSGILLEDRDYEVISESRNDINKFKSLFK